MWLVVPDTGFHVTCSKKNMAFHKLHAAARLLHWFPYISVSWTYQINFLAGSNSETTQLKLTMSECLKRCYARTKLRPNPSDSHTTWLQGMSINFLERKFGKFKISSKVKNHSIIIALKIKAGLQIHMQQFYLLFTQNMFITQHMFILYIKHTSDLNSPCVLFFLALVVTMVVSDNKCSRTVVYTRLTKINSACLLFL